MNIDSIVKRANKVLKAHEDKKHASKVHIIDANGTKDIENLNGLVIAVNKLDQAVQDAV